MSATTFPPFNFFKCPSPLVPVATVDEEPTPSNRMQGAPPVSEVDEPTLSDRMQPTLSPPAASADAVHSYIAATALPDLLSQLRMALLEFKNTKVIHPVRTFFSTWQPRYLPYPVDESNLKPHLNDYTCAVLRPDDVQSIWDEEPGLVVDRDAIRSRLVEVAISSATERICLWPGVVHKTLYRGSIVKFNFPPYMDDSDHKLFISNMQFMRDEDAFVRVVGYNRSGLRVHPCDGVFGTFILAIPREKCDVLFPPETSLYEHTLHMTADSPHLHHYIRQASSGAMTFI